MKIVQFYVVFLCLFIGMYVEAMQSNIVSDFAINSENFYESANFVFNFPEKKITGDLQLENDEMHYVATFDGVWSVCQMIRALQGQVILMDLEDVMFFLGEENKNMHIEFFSECLGLLSIEDAEFSSRGEKLQRKITQRGQMGNCEEIFYYTNLGENLFEIKKINISTGEEQTEVVNIFDKNVSKEDTSPYYNDNFSFKMTVIFEENVPIELDFDTLREEGKNWQQAFAELFSLYYPDTKFDSSSILSWEDWVSPRECGFWSVICDGVQEIGNDLLDIGIGLFEEAKRRWNSFWEG